MISPGATALVDVLETWVTARELLWEAGPRAYVRDGLGRFASTAGGSMADMDSERAAIRKAGLADEVKHGKRLADQMPPGVEMPQRTPWETQDEWRQRVAVAMGYVGGKEYYHVAGPDYEAGTDLKSASVLRREGKPVANKWGDRYDTENVSLSDNFAASMVFAEDHLGGNGTILAVSVPKTAKLSVNDEGYPVMRRRVPAKWVRRLSAVEVSALATKAAEARWAQHPEDRAKP